MGYCIDLIDQSFTIKAENRPFALEAIRALDPVGAVQGGGGMFSKDESYTCFRWMHGVRLAEMQTLQSALEAWRFQPEFSGNGDIVCLDFIGEKIGDERILFAAIAPFVERGSYLAFRGEDGHVWRYFFDGTAMMEQAGTIAWDTRTEKEVRNGV